MAARNSEGTLVFQSVGKLRCFTFYHTCMFKRKYKYPLSRSPLYITTTPASGALTQAIRNFAKSLENWLTGAMMNIPEEMVRIKVIVFNVSSDHFS